MMQQVYGSDCLSRATINEWFRRFKDGRKHLTDDERDIVNDIGDRFF